VQMVTASSMSRIMCGPVVVIVLLSVFGGCGACCSLMAGLLHGIMCRPVWGMWQGVAVPIIQGVGTSGTGASAASMGCSGVPCMSFTLSHGRAIMGVPAGGLMVPCNMDMTVCKASVYASVRGTRRELGEGCFNACVMLVMLARMWSMEVALAMGVLVGSQVRVLQIC